MRPHAIDDLGHADDAAEQQLGRQADANAPLDIVAANIIRTLRA
jgi:hypothetical protein